MFKNLRNRLLIINSLIIAALILFSFSVIYVMTSQNINQGINQKLERAMAFMSSSNPTTKKPIPPNDENLLHDTYSDVHSNAHKLQRNEIPDGRQEFSLSFCIKTDLEGNIEEVFSPFDFDEDFYSDKLPDVVSADAIKGEMRSSSGIWRYKCSPKKDGYIIAFTECKAEHNMLRNLFLILLFVGVLALSVAFLISFFFANRSIRPIEESYNKQKQFVADASHELKTPLTTINTNIDVLLAHGDSTINDEKKWLEYIKDEAARMTKLTNDLLYLARLDHDNNVMYGKTSFSQAAESVILLMEAVAFEKGINLEYNIEPNLFVNASPEQLKQLVMILIDNAVKYTQKNGRADITLKNDGNDAVLSVKNTGEGISETAQKQIFERFYREDKSRARESGGYGLGLSIAKAIAVSFKGSIKVSSKKNEYAEFIVKIPLAK